MIATLLISIAVFYISGLLADYIDIDSPEYYYGILLIIRVISFAIIFYLIIKSIENYVFQSF